MLLRQIPTLVEIFGRQPLKQLPCGLRFKRIRLCVRGRRQWLDRQNIILRRRRKRLGGCRVDGRKVEIGKIPRGVLQVAVVVCQRSIECQCGKGAGSRGHGDVFFVRRLSVFKAPPGNRQRLFVGFAQALETFGILIGTEGFQ
ncbi:hypothetical protein D3C81_1754400 [compost metagenome]